VSLEMEILEFFLFYVSILAELIIGYWYTVLAEQLPEPGSTMALVAFLILLCAIFNSSFKFGEFLIGSKTWIEIAPGWLFDEVLGICLIFIPLFYSVMLHLPNQEFFLSRCFLMVIAWFIPYLFIFKSIKERLR